jgi:hypothetical protein
MASTVYTQDGEELVCDILDSTVAQPTWYGGWGTGGGAADKADSALKTEASETRVATTDSQPSADINQFLFEITADGTKTITNAGILDASTSGNLLIIGDFTGIALESGDKIEFTVQLTQS